MGETLYDLESSVLQSEMMEGGTEGGGEGNGFPPSVGSFGGGGGGYRDVRGFMDRGRGAGMIGMRVTPPTVNVGESVEEVMEWRERRLSCRGSSRTPGSDVEADSRKEVSPRPDRRVVWMWSGRRIRARLLLLLLAAAEFGESSLGLVSSVIDVRR